MKNNQQQILSEIKSLLASVKTQLGELENKIAEFEQCAENQDVVEDAPIEDVVEDVVEEVVEEPVVESVVEVEDEVMDIELEPSDDLPFYDDLPVTESEVELETEASDDIVPESQVAEEPQLVEEPVAEEPVVEVDDLPEVVTVVTPEAAAPVPVIDAMIAKQAWRTDMPGSSVRDIRSAISLNDRILFINYLFGEDPMAFQEMLTQLNAMSSFDEAAAHAVAAHPEWDLESDTVYRFMMALRRRHQ